MGPRQCIITKNAEKLETLKYKPDVTAVHSLFKIKYFVRKY